MKGRKTVDVEDMVRWANGTLAYSGHSQSFKAGICTMIENLLMRAGRYEGFRYESSDRSIYYNGSESGEIDPQWEYDRQYYLRDSNGSWIVG